MCNPVVYPVPATHDLICHAVLSCRTRQTPRHKSRTVNCAKVPHPPSLCCPTALDQQQAHARCAHQSQR
ncbi:MAG: hypothetical protein ACP5I8_15945, partial [Phycisphaerae bacterium]